MKHVTYGEKSLLMGDDAADALLEYSRVVANEGHADTVSFRSISPDGNVGTASFLLNASTVLMVETTNSTVDAPDNAEEVAEVRRRIDAVLRPAPTEPGEPWSSDGREAPSSIIDV
ncbi:MULTISPECIES: hypothetical protein [Microbacterium]|uniref:hypothetical protein n=1 Tax=Microbacterium TaxID=33882 RepID=UPI0011EAF7B7|nr:MULTISPECIES: hypothetical protein [Microbacterium]